MGGGGADKLVRRDGRGQGHVESSIAVGVGGDAGRAEIELTLAIAARVSFGVVIEIQGEGGVGIAVQRALDYRRAVRVGLGEGDDRIVLQVVAAGIRVVRVVDIHAIRPAQVDAQLRVSVDAVAANCVPQAGVADSDPTVKRGAAVVGNDVAFARSGPANDIVVAGQKQAVVAVAQRCDAIRADANPVANDYHVRRVGADAFKGVGGDDVVADDDRNAGCAADAVVVGQRRQASGVHAHPVPGDDGGRRAGVGRVVEVDGSDGGLAVAGDQVALQVIGKAIAVSADAVSVAAQYDAGARCAAETVGDRSHAGDVGADLVAGDDVV